MAAWPMKIMAGDYEGTIGIRFGTLWTGPKADKFDGVEFSKPKQRFRAEDLKRVKLLSAETTKTFFRTAGAGILGGALLGPAGLIAGTLVGGKKTVERYGLEFLDGSRVIVAADDNKPFRCLLMYAEREGLIEKERVEF